MIARGTGAGLTRRVAVSAAISVTGLIAVFVLLALAVDNLRGQTDERRDAQKIRLAADRLQTSVLDLETGLRAFLLTGQETFLEPWRAARNRLPAEKSRLLAAAVAADAPSLSAASEQIADRVDDYFFGYSLPTVLRARGERLDPDAVDSETAEGKRRVDELRGRFQSLFDAQAEILAREERDAASAADIAFTIAAVGLVLLVGAAMAQVFYIRRAVTGPVMQVAAAASALAAGRKSSSGTVTDLRLHPAQEIRSLTESFDLMAMAIGQQTDRLERRVRERTADLEQAQHEALLMLAVAAEFRDDDTHRHTQRVGRNAALIGRALGLGEDTIELLRVAAPLHDVGKIGIPDSILLKPGRLTAEEFETMQRHTVIGASILGASAEPIFHIAAQIACTHHERWDGTGYPAGLAGAAIPMAGRIVAVVDVFDALTHARPYKEAWPLDRACEEILRGAGSHFDPDVVAAFVQLPAEQFVLDLAAADAPAPVR